MSVIPEDQPGGRDNSTFASQLRMSSLQKTRVKLEISCWDLVGNCSAAYKQLECWRMRSKHTLKNEMEPVLMILTSVLKAVKLIKISYKPPYSGAFARGPL